VSADSFGQHFKGLKILSVAPMLAQIIQNVHEDKSVTHVMSS
jgi:phosphoribosylpyrophosphate synthetase